jgi:hypothetical protein
VRVGDDCERVHCEQPDRAQAACEAYDDEHGKHELAGSADDGSGVRRQQRHAIFGFE